MVIRDLAPSNCTTSYVVTIVKIVSDAGGRLFLVEGNSKDPRYLTFDHRTPRREDNIVIVAQAINDMKSDMSDREFRRMVLQLANRFSGGEFNLKGFQPQILDTLTDSQRGAPSNREEYRNRLSRGGQYSWRFQQAPFRDVGLQDIPET